MQDAIDAFEKLKIKFPKNKELFQELINTYENLQNLQNQFIDIYAKDISRKVELLWLGFEIAFQGSINQKELLNVEINDIDNLLHKGVIQNEIALLNYSSKISVRPNEITKLYYRLIKGNEFDIIEKAVDNQDYELINDLSTTRALVFYREIIRKELLDIEQNNTVFKIIPLEQTETKTEKLKAVLGQYGFFELPKVKRLSEPAKQSLIELIGKNDLPYSIAMLNFLDFLNHLEKEYFKTKYKLNIEVAKWFDSDKDGRRIKGNISVLSDYSNENKSKFTAHLHKETVKIDYQNLK
jgi:hypothetical protein